MTMKKTYNLLYESQCPNFQTKGFRVVKRNKHFLFDTVSAGFHFGILRLKKRDSRRCTNSLEGLQKQCYIDGHFP